MKNQYGKTILEIALQNGIRQDITAPYTPEQNSPAEASNKAILTRACCLLTDANMPVISWFGAISHAIFLTNHFFNLTTNNVPTIHFHEALRIAHHSIMDFT